MNRIDQFWRSINTLATAYFEGRLSIGSCNACAVGNLIKGELDPASYHTNDWPEHYEVNEDWTRSREQWYSVLTAWRDGTLNDAEVATVLPYTNAELDAIEQAFEERPPQDDIFDRLMDVVDVLFKIHDVEGAARSKAQAVFEDEDYDTVEAVLS
jgi:hypothetical protein